MKPVYGMNFQACLYLKYRRPYPPWTFWAQYLLRSLSLKGVVPLIPSSDSSGWGLPDMYLGSPDAFFSFGCSECKVLNPAGI